MICMCKILNGATLLSWFLLTLLSFKVAVSQFNGLREPVGQVIGGCQRQVGSQKTENPLVTRFLRIEQRKKDQVVYFAESWEKGPRRIQPQTFYLELSTTRPEYEATISDDSGSYQYKFRVEPVRSSDQSSSIGYWQFTLIGAESEYSLLQPRYPAGHHFTQEDFLSLLYPVESADWKITGYFGVPLSAKRVIKVEAFYCVIQVQSFKISSSNSRALEMVNVEVEFTNYYDGFFKQR